MRLLLSSLNSDLSISHGKMEFTRIRQPKNISVVPKIISSFLFWHILYTEKTTELPKDITCHRLSTCSKLTEPVPVGNCPWISHCGWWRWSLTYKVGMSSLSQTIAICKSSRKHLTIVLKTKYITFLVVPALHPCTQMSNTKISNLLPSRMTLVHLSTTITWTCGHRSGIVDFCFQFLA